MCNIYLHELDEFVEDTLIPEFSVGEKRVADKAKDYQVRHVLKEELKSNPIIKELPQLKKIIPILKKNKSIIDKNTSYYKEGEYYKRLHYVRYADDILLGVVGTKEDCRKIVPKIDVFLKNNLNLELNLSKCSINLAWETNTNFLGFDIGGYQNKIASEKRVLENVVVNNLTSRAINNLGLIIPTKNILDRLTEKGYLRKLPKSNRYKGTGIGKLT